MGFRTSDHTTWIGGIGREGDRLHVSASNMLKKTKVICLENQEKPKTKLKTCVICCAKDDLVALGSVETRAAYCRARG